MKERTTWVKAGGEWVDLDDTEFLNVSEDLYGRDTITFEYEGDTYESIAVNGSRPS